MARVQSYERQVSRAAPNQQDFEAANYGEGMGRGLQVIGQAASGFAEAEVRLRERRAEDEVRLLDIEHAERAAEIGRAVRSTRGLAAAGAVAQAQTQLRQLDSELLSRTSSRLARRRAEQSFRTRNTIETDGWTNYAVGQEREAGDNAITARVGTMFNSALDHPAGSTEAESYRVSGEGEIRALATRQGWDQAQVDQRLLEYRSDYHSARVNQLFQAEAAEEAEAYIEAHRGEMTADDEQRSWGIIRPELVANEVESRGAGFIVFEDGGQATTTERPADSSSSPATSRQQVMRRIRGSESGGNDSARNPRGSASGRYQFIRSTFIPLHRQVFGGNMTDDQRWSQRNSGEVQERMMNAAMDSYERILGRNRSTPGNLYLAHFAGPERARRIIDNPGASISSMFSAREIGDNPMMRSMSTVGELAAWTNRRMGGRNERVTAPAATGRRVDLEATYARIAESGASPSMQRRYREWARGYAGEQDQVRARTEQDAERQINTALDGIAQSGGRLTSLTQLPAAALRNASPGTIANLQASITANNRRDVEANGEVHTQLSLLSISDPNAFARTSLEQYRGRVTDAELESLRISQARMQAGQGAQPGEIMTVMRMVSPGLFVDPSNRLGSRPDMERRAGVSSNVATGAGLNAANQAMLLQAVQARLRREHGVANPSQEEIARAVRAETAMVTMNGQHLPVYQAERQGGQNIQLVIPPAARAVVVRNLQQNGIQPTSSNVAREYLRDRQLYDRAAR